MKSMNSSAQSANIGLPAARPLVFYKDFHKNVKDVLTKNFTDSAKWKVECKFKGPKDVLIVNPTATSDGTFCTDVEFHPHQCAASLKANVNPAGDVKVTTAYTHLSHKLEAVLGSDGRYEITHEGQFQDRLSSHVKLVKEAVEVGFGLPVARHCHIGCGSTYLLKDKKSCEWSLSCRYADGSRVVSIRTNKLQTYTTSLMTPIPTCPHHVLVAAEVVCGRGKGWDGTIAVEAGCLLRKGNVLKARVNKNKEWAIAYVAKLADNWTAAVTLDKNMKAGVLLTHA